MPDLVFTYPKILDNFEPYLAHGRSESASFLIWYLVNYYRLDVQEAIDSVCDQSGDRGVDGIYVNDGAGTIDIFQSKLSQKGNSSIGDRVLKEFQGTVGQFSDAGKLKNLVQNAGDAEVAKLIQRLDLVDHLAGYEVRGMFLSNLDIDRNGIEYLENHPNISFAGQSELVRSYISDLRDQMQTGEAFFDISGIETMEYFVDAKAKTKAVIAPIPASELVRLSGIEDQSLFSANVRASLGRTQVNRDIVNSIKDPSLHKQFPLFHNGITVIAKKVERTEEQIKIVDYFVVNGCQSLNSLFGNRKSLTPNLKLLVKFIQTDENELKSHITAYSNNQNGVKARDFKSNHQFQTRLQNEFGRFYMGEYVYEVKRGEPTGKGESITNEDAGLWLIAFDLGEPWTTHRKYQVFDDKYSEIFGRPNVTADRIVLLNLLQKIIAEELTSMRNQLVAKYVLTKFLILHTVRKIFEIDDVGQQILLSPEVYVRDDANRKKFETALKEIIVNIVIDFDADVSDLPEGFDYRGKLRDKAYVMESVGELVANYRKDIRRNKARSLATALGDPEAL